MSQRNLKLIIILLLFIRIIHQRSQTWNHQNWVKIKQHLNSLILIFIKEKICSILMIFKQINLKENQRINQYLLMNYIAKLAKIISMHIFSMLIKMIIKKKFKWKVDLQYNKSTVLMIKSNTKYKINIDFHIRNIMAKNNLNLQNK